jgi:hypothetical protein
MDKNHARKNEFREITAELWRIQDEMDNLKSCMWRTLHRLGRALEEIDEDE